MSAKDSESSRAQSSKSPKRDEAAKLGPNDFIRITGHVVKVHARFALIRPERGGDNVFLHLNVLRKAGISAIPRVGARIVFDALRNKNDLIAVRVVEFKLKTKKAIIINHYDDNDQVYDPIETYDNATEVAQSNVKDDTGLEIDGIDGNTVEPALGREEEGLLSESKEDPDLLLDLWLDAMHVPRDARAAHLVTFRYMIGMRISSGAKWREKKKYDELAELSAPLFLKRVHDAHIVDGRVYKETIRAYDRELMKAVEGYISQRGLRERNLGDAAGLFFVISKPATNKIEREPERRPVGLRKRHLQPNA